MGVNPAEKPLINGILYEAYASIEAAIAGKDRYVTAVNYSDSLDTKDVNANSSIRVGEIVGRYKVESIDFEMPLADANALVEDLGDGFGKVRFPIVVRYSVDGERTITDTIERVGIKKVETVHNDGEAVKRKFTCTAHRIKWNGKYLMA